MVPHLGQMCLASSLQFNVNGCYITLNSGFTYLPKCNNFTGHVPRNLDVTHDLTQVFKTLYQCIEKFVCFIEKPMSLYTLVFLSKKGNILSFKVMSKITASIYIQPNLKFVLHFFLNYVFNNTLTFKKKENTMFFYLTR